MKLNKPKQTERIIAMFILLLYNSVLPQLMAKSFQVKSQGEYLLAEGSANTGDTIVWAAGTFQDVDWQILKDGLTILTAIPGTSIFTGTSHVEIKASKVFFSGFQFVGGSTKGDVCKISGSYNRIEQLNFSDYHSGYYLNITPGCQYNLIQYCNFERKPEDRQTSVVEIQVDEKIPGYHVLRYCSFKDHTAPPNAGGDYGIEALRIGYSYQSKFISRTLVEYCYFSRCNGDGEVISSKARENVFRYNTFQDNGESHFTLRHGSDNVVCSNFFLQGAGLRIKEGQNQMVYNNYFETGDFWAIRLENYKVDPLKNVVITNNTFYHSGPVKLGGTGDFQPTGVSLDNNIFYKASSSILDDPTGKESYSGNVLVETSTSVKNGFSPSSVKMKMNEFGFLEPEKKVFVKEAKMPAILDIPELDDDPKLNLDIAKNKRPASKKTAGCYEVSGKSQPIKQYVNASNTGPEYLGKK